MHGDGDEVWRVAVDLLRSRRGRQLRLAPRGLEHVLRVVKHLPQIGFVSSLKHIGFTEPFNDLKGKNTKCFKRFNRVANDHGRKS